MVKNTHLNIKTIIMIIAISLLCSVLASCASAPVNDIELEDLPLDGNYARVTDFQIKDDTIYYTSESMTIGYCGLDGDESGMLINPYHNPVYDFQIEGDWIYFWASETALCKVNLSDHNIMEIYDINILDLTDTVSWIVYDSCLYCIHYQDDEYPDAIDVVDLDDMSCSQIACGELIDIVQIYDRYLFVKTDAAEEDGSGMNTLMRIDMQNNNVEKVMNVFSKTELQIRGNYLVSLAGYNLEIQQIDGTRKQEIDGSIELCFAGKDALYYRTYYDVYKINYEDYSQEHIYDLSPAKEGLIFPYFWYSADRNEYGASLHYFTAYTDLIYYKTGETIQVTMPEFLQFSQDNIDTYCELFHEDDVCSLDYSIDGKLVILEIEEETETILYDRMGNEQYKKLLDNEMLALSPEEVRYVVFVNDTLQKVGYYGYDYGHRAYKQHIYFYIYDVETKELVYCDKVTGSYPPDSVEAGNDGYGSYPIDEFIDKLLGIGNVAD